MVAAKTKIIIISLVASLILISQFLIMPAWLSIPMTVVLCVQSLIALYLTYKFYGSQPESQKTVLNYLLQLFMVVTAIGVVWHTVAEVLMAVPQVLVPAFEAHLDSACTFLRYELIMIPYSSCVMAIITFEMVLVVDSFKFLAMDHELRFKQAAVVIVGTVVAELLAVFLWCKTFCTDVKLKRIEEVTGLRLDIENYSTAHLPMNAITMILICIGQLTLTLLKMRNKRKVKPYKTLSVTSTTTCATDYHKSILGSATYGRRKKTEPIFNVQEETSFTIDMEQGKKDLDVKVPMVTTQIPTLISVAPCNQPREDGRKNSNSSASNCHHTAQELIEFEELSVSKIITSEQTLMNELSSSSLLIEQSTNNSVKQVTEVQSTSVRMQSKSRPLSGSRILYQSNQRRKLKWQVSESLVLKNRQESAFKRCSSSQPAPVSYWYSSQSRRTLEGRNQFQQGIEVQQSQREYNKSTGNVATQNREDRPLPTADFSSCYTAIALTIPAILTLVTIYISNQTSVVQMIEIVNGCIAQLLPITWLLLSEDLSQYAIRKLKAFLQVYI